MSSVADAVLKELLDKRREEASSLSATCAREGIDVPISPKYLFYMPTIPRGQREITLGVLQLMEMKGHIEMNQYNNFRITQAGIDFMMNKQSESDN